MKLVVTKNIVMLFMNSGRDAGWFANVGATASDRFQLARAEPSDTAINIENIGRAGLIIGTLPAKPPHSHVRFHRCPRVPLVGVRMIISRPRPGNDPNK